MKKRPILVWIVALVSLGSGLINLSSLTFPALPERTTLLREVFPLEFLHLSRFLTLLSGFALIVSSINIYKRKKRAFQGVLLLACVSVIFHLTKGLDYEEALFSLLLVAILLASRRHFTVCSSVPDLRWALVRFSLAVLVAFGYGVAGFWLLDRREFGIDFSFEDSVHRALLFFSLVGDPQVVPHTRYARWFVNSLYLMTVTAVGYSIFALYRPVIYRFRTLPRERALAANILAKYGRSSLDYFKLRLDKSYFFSPSRDCFLAYCVGGNFAVVLADPVGPEEKMEQTIRGFSEYCEQNDWGLGFHQVLPDFLPIYRRFGFRKLKIGDDAVVDLMRFNLDGKSMKRIRHNINLLDKSGFRILHFEPPISDEILRQVKEVSDDWLQLPGRRERRFTVGMFEPNYIRSTPLFTVADKDSRILAFANIVPSYRKGEATVDLMRRRLDVPNGIMDYLFVKLFIHDKERGFERFNLGMAPMAGFREKEEASKEERAVHYFFQHLNFLFSYRGLWEYKSKFATFWEPRYLIYRNPLDLPRLVIALGKVAGF
ncbi:MAG: bifunctional lysylphosphatidylglycerol flippase/synthetase MprF [Acidobacteria bacterium]|nr:bifunctional lysylphosphatidylglycerol flippase/synthetase MprF [Acidobacteriota bacterium]